MFVIGDYIFHPLHGVGMIREIISKRICGESREYYVLTLPLDGMTVMVPVLGCESVGVRSIIEPSVASSVIESFSGIEINMSPNWNKRYRDNMELIKSGRTSELAAVVKGLMLRELQRGLSTGERKMLVTAKHILISELMVSLNSSYEEIESRLLSAVMPCQS